MVKTQVLNQTAIDKTTQQGSAIRYLCKDDKEVRVVRNVRTDKKSSKKAKSKSERISLTFEGVTEKLIFTVSESGRKYTSIHWHWYEIPTNNVLTNSIGEILAEQCVEQAASTAIPSIR